MKRVHSRLSFAQFKSRSSTFGSVHSKMAATFEKKLASAVENLPVLYDKTLQEFKDKNKKKNAWLYSSWVWSQVSDIKVAEISRAIQCFLPV